ncbi:BlaI/MecI/CopY family transcriptional regulator [Streptomyces sp. NPDC052023]|uniref:BlaI/MecI/CopY family transcriptional regulator n=1 Tax=Streptomyces sp. NPDC052023 TaxID=3365681 RepID=UPI0037D90D8C
MTRVWKWNRPVTVREVLEDLQQERSIAYTTVMTVLDNLHQKGWVRREAEGRAYRYEAVSTRAAYAAALMNDAWSQSDNAAAALVAFFGMMSEDQRQALRDAVRIVSLPEPPGSAPAAEATPSSQPPEPVKSAERAEPPEAANTRPDTRGENGTDNRPDIPPDKPAGMRTDKPADKPADIRTGNPAENPAENPGSVPEGPGR